MSPEFAFLTFDKMIKKLECLMIEFFTSLLSPQEYKLMLAAALGLIMGIERELAGKDPGLRTFTLICLGSCLFTMLSASLAENNQYADPGRIAAQIISGIGFLGAGTIFRSRERVTGLTTAALMWVTAAIGMAIGFNKISLAITASIITIVLVFMLGLVHKVRYRLGIHPGADKS